MLANDEQQSSASSPELRTIPLSVELLASEKTEGERSSGMSVESWNGAENAELQTGKKSLEQQTNETTTVPQTSEKNPEPHTSKTTTEPHTSETTTEPQTSEKNPEPLTSETTTEPQTSEKSLEARTSEKNPESQTSETTVEPQTTEKNLEPQTTETTVEPQTTEKNLEPQTSETTVEPQTTEKNLEPQTSETAEEPQTTEKNLEPQTSETTVEPQTTEKNLEPQTSETAVEPHTTEKNLEPQTSETTVELQTTEKNLEPQTSDTTTEPQTSERTTEPQTSETTAEPQTSETTAELQISQKNPESQTTEKNPDTQTSETTTEPQTSEKNPKPQTSETTAEQQTSEKNPEPQTSKTTAEPQTSELSEVPWISEASTEPQTSEKSPEPQTSKTTAEPQTSKKSKDPLISEDSTKPRTSLKSVKLRTSEKKDVQLDDKSMEPKTREKSVKPRSREKSAKPRTIDKIAKTHTRDKSTEPWSKDISEEQWTSEKIEEPWSSEKSEEPWSSEKSEEPWSSEKSEEPWSSETTEMPWSSKKREDLWSSTLEPETEASGLFTTAVTEEKLQEAREKSQKRVFGSSQVFWHIEDRKGQSNVYSFPHIVQSRANEHYETGLALLSRGDTEEAVVAFSKAVNLRPDQIELYLKKAEAFLQLCDFQSAALNLRKACSAASPKEEYLSLLAFTLYLQGQCLFDSESYLGALESFTCASELQPWKHMYHLRSIACLAPLGRYSDCLRLVSKLLEEDKLNPDLYVLRARLHYKFNKILLCYQDVGEALRLESDHRAAKALRRYLKNQADESRALAVIKAVEGQLHEALSKICSAIEHDPADAEYYTFRGTLYRRLQDFSSAMDDFVLAMQLSGATEIPPVATRAVEAPPELPVTRAPGESPQGRSVTDPTAGEQPSVFLEAQKQLLLTYNDFAVQCYKKGFYEEGVLLLNKAIKGQKHEMGLYMNRGDCLFQLGELSLALADYQQALDLSPLDSGVRHRIAMLQDELGLQEQQQRRYHEAEVHFSRAIENQPRLAAYYLHRARVRLCLQEHAGAQEDALTALLLDSSSSEAEPLVMGFFPGKSLLEILSSKQCAVTKERLERNLQTCPSSQLQEKTKRGKRQGIPRGAEDASDGETDACSKVAQCLTDGVVYTEMVQGRKRINQEIQRVLQTKGDRMSSADRKAAQASKGSMPPEAPVHWVTMDLTSTLN